MACRTRHSFAVTGLVSAYLDLAIAYILLCASTIVFFASKFLGCFGLGLPCSCNGLFGNSNTNYCLKKRLIDYPIEKVSSVKLSVKGSFPFDAVPEKDMNYWLNLRLIGDIDNSGVEIGGGESSCSSISGNKRLENVAERDLIRRNDAKGKGIVHRPRSGLRRRRKCVVDHGRASSGRLSSAGSYTFHIDNKRAKVIDLNSVPDEPRDGAYPSLGDEEEQISRNIGETGPQGFAMIETVDEDKPSENISQKELDSDGNDTSRDALYFELEKERSAAASAADEAMAMILRLQKEKAAIEMEARQYRRMIEEKSAYDNEEMNILKEIIVQREMEKHSLEKEVELYRNIIGDDNQLYQDAFQNIANEGEPHDFSLHLDEDPVLMLQQLSESIDKNEMVKDKYSDSDISSTDKLNIKHTVETQGDMDQQFSCILGKQQEENSEMTNHQGTTVKTIEAHDVHIPQDGTSLKEYGEDAHKGSVDLNVEPRIYDIHVINGDGESPNGVRDSRNQCFNLTSKESEIRQVDSHPTSGNSRRSSDMRAGLPPLAARKSKVPNLRRNSMSAADSERLKIDSEIEWLRERLRIVQEGREKLNISMEHQERETLQLKILDGLASQLREIRKLTDPVKAVHQASFQLPSSKVLSKKRRCQSLPLEI